ncbi:MAG: hypothetical protein D6731_19050, partial [Planctomycetota bacterium]
MQQRVPTPSASPFARFLLRNFVVYNPLFLFSAALLLAGAWLLNPPAPGQERSVPLLLKLFALVQLYEFSLLGAALLLARRRGTARDVRNLALVLAPFLLDVSFTTSSLETALLNYVDTWQGMLAVSALALGTLLPLAWAKLRLAARATGQRFRRAELLALFAGPVLVTASPLLGGFLPLFGLRTEGAFLEGVGVALLALVLARLAVSERASGPALRRLAPLVLAGVLCHANATAWANAVSTLLVSGPLLLVGGVVLPALAWPDRRARDAATPLLLPALGALALGAVDAPLFGVGSWQVGLWAASASFAFEFVRRRSLASFASLLVVAHAASGGVSLEASLDRLGQNPFEPLLLLALFGYGVWRRAHPAALAPPLLLAALRVADLVPLQHGVDAAVGAQVLGAGLLVWTHREHGRRPEAAWLRVAGVLWLVVPLVSVAYVLGPGPHDGVWAYVLSGATLALLLVLAGATRERLYAYPSLLLGLEPAVSFAPASSQGWGALVLLAAFVTVCLGVALALQRERLLAWLEAPAPTAPA